MGGITNMKWNSKVVRALFVAAAIGSMVLASIAESGWA
jgi:hypothetical protein